MLKITFNNDPKTKAFVLGLFKNSIDDERYILDDKGNRIIDSDGQEMTIDQLGAIKNGSQIYVKRNIVSLVGFYKRYLQGK